MPEYIIMFNDEWVPAHTPQRIMEKSAAVTAVVDDMKEAGIFVYAHGALSQSTVLCSVTVNGGQAAFRDQPYRSRAEYLGGFTVIDVPSDEAARSWAGRLARALEWPQEVHRFPASPVVSD